jgi:hypothetical protein
VANEAEVRLVPLLVRVQARISGKPVVQANCPRVRRHADQTTERTSAGQQIDRLVAGCPHMPPVARSCFFEEYPSRHE